MNHQIKAIETRYRGYRMRSRLEARWAVFFDAMGIHWRYESEGFNVNGRPYLPDFFLPYTGGEIGWGMWVEIKPVPLTTEQAKLIDGLVKGTGHRAFAICGDPWPGAYTVSVFQHYHDGAPKASPLHSECQFYERQRIVDGDSFFDFGLWGSHGAFPFVDARVYQPQIETLGYLKRAFSEARGARFEHNERDNIRPQPAVSMPRVSDDQDAQFAACKTEEEKHALFMEIFNKKRAEQAALAERGNP